MKVKELLKDRRRWTKNTRFRDEHGSIVYDMKNAHSFCLVAAVVRCYYNPIPTIQKLKRKLGVLPSHWNDRASHDQVIALCEELDI